MSTDDEHGEPVSQQEKLESRNDRLTPDSLPGSGAKVDELIMVCLNRLMAGMG